MTNSYSSMEVGIDSRQLSRPFAASRIEENPPVIILNMYHSGLGIARNLQGSGIRVLGLCSDRQSPGSRTKLCEIQIAPDSQNEPIDLLQYLENLPDEFTGAVIFPTRDGDVDFLDRFRERLRLRFRLAIPTHDCLQNVTQKDVLAEFAQAVGVPVPRTMKLNDKANLNEVEKRIGYPCVVKPVSALDWRRGHNWQEVGCRKAFLVSSHDEFRKEYLQLEAITPSVLVQEWIPGNSSQIGILGGYVGPDSELLAWFTARKLVQSPDDFGTGCIVESSHIDGLFEPSARLFKALNYRGMAEVEFKWDERDNKYKLIEINTRHWDQHELASASGINLSRLAYDDALGKANAPLKKMPTLSAKWVAEDALILHSLRALYHGQSSLGDILRSLKGRRVYGLFSWGDPRPFLFSMVQLGSSLIKQIPRSLRRGR